MAPQGDEVLNVKSTENKPIAVVSRVGNPLTFTAILLLDAPKFAVAQPVPAKVPEAVFILYGSVEDVLNVNCENAIFTKNERSVESMYLEKVSFMRLK